MATNMIQNAIANLLPSDLYPILVTDLFLPRYHAVSPIPVLTKKLPKIIGTDIVFPQIGQSTVTTTTTDEFTGAIEVQPVTATSTTVKLNQVSMWAYQIPPFMETMAKGDFMAQQLYDNAKTMSDTIGQQVLSQMFEGAANRMGTAVEPVEISIENAYNNLIDMNTTLNKLNVPSRGRRYLIDYDYYNLLEKELHLGRDVNVEPNGYISGLTISGYEVYVTNLLTSTPGSTNDKGEPTLPSGQAMLIQEDAFGYKEIIAKSQYIPGESGNMCETMQGAMRWGAGYLLPGNVVACTCSYEMEMPSNITYVESV